MEVSPERHVARAGLFQFTRVAVTGIDDACDQALGVAGAAERVGASFGPLRLALLQLAVQRVIGQARSNQHKRIALEFMAAMVPHILDRQPRAVENNDVV